MLALVSALASAPALGAVSIVGRALLASAFPRVGRRSSQGPLERPLCSCSATRGDVGARELGLHRPGLCSRTAAGLGWDSLLPRVPPSCSETWSLLVRRSPLT